MITLCVVSEFVNRNQELALLKERYDRDQADLVVLYGRRRMGKSALARESIQDHADAILYQAAEVTPELQQQQFAETIANVHPDAADLRHDWEPLLRFLADQNAPVIIDEFPYLVTADESIPSRLQRVWDQHLEHSGITLVLIGSSISIMEDQILAGKSPLYGRRTATIDLGPLPINHLDTFLPGLTPEETIHAWSLFGGSPHTLRALNPDQSLQANTQQLLLNETGLLHDEPELLLRAELREPNTYFSILRAIARGRTQRNEIAQAAGIQAETISSYLARLRRLRIIHRDVPATENPTRSRRGRYHIRDPLFRTWFRFIHANQANLARLGDNAYNEIIKPHLADHASWTFETLCHQALPTLAPGTYRRLGRWWFREHELDLAALRTDHTQILGECKFTTRKMNPSDLTHLETTAQHVQWTTDEPNEPTTHQYALFSRSGFTQALQDQAQHREDLSLWTIEDVVQALHQPTPNP